MSFRLVQISVTLNDLEPWNGPYFALFYRICVRCRRKTIVSFVKQLLVLPRFQNILVIVYDHINSICAISQQTLITRCDGRRCIDNWVHRLPLTRSYSRNYELSVMGVGPGLYLYVVVVKRSRSLSHLLMSSCSLKFSRRDRRGDATFIVCGRKRLDSSHEFGEIMQNKGHYQIP